ncbi:MAG: hypothetical protein HUJ42_02890, partial [Malacoplasma sp.]|nr:hypothetical protein [Malacoplasma sp.]
MKKKKLIFSSLFTSFLITASIGIGVSQSLSHFTNQNAVFKTNSELNADTATTQVNSGIVDLKTDANQNSQVNLPLSYYKQNDIGNFANPNGTILLFDNARTVGATDWYGNLSWYITLNSASGKSDGYYSESWFSTSTSSAIDFSNAGTKVVDMAYNYKTDVLYVLTDTNYLIILNSKDGSIISANKLTNTVDKIQVIDFDNSVYLWNSKTAAPTVYQVDPKTGMPVAANKGQISTSTSLSGKYLIGLIPLDVNYSIAVTSTSAINATTDNASVSLTLTIVNDSLVAYPTDKSGTSATPQTVSISSVKGNDIYMNGFARNGSYVIMVNKSIYQLILNKSSIEKSTFTDLLNQTQTSQSQPAQSGTPATTADKFTIPGNINSAFIDSNNQIYFKTDESPNITSISVANVFTNSIVIQSTGTNVVFSSEDSAKNAQVFPVANPSAGTDALKSYPFTGYVLSNTNFVGTGFTNDSLMPRQFTS